MTSALPGFAGGDTADDDSASFEADEAVEIAELDEVEASVSEEIVEPDDPADDGFEEAIAQKQRETEEGLSEQQQRMLVFERQWWRHAGSKEQAIREQFNLSATRYYQMLNRLLDTPAALEFDALVVGRLRRLRATRARSRFSR